MNNIVDASNLVIRLASRTRNICDKSFLESLLEFIYFNSFGIESLIFVFEGINSTENRRQIYPQYKMGRSDIRDDEYIYTSYALTKRLFNILGIFDIDIDGLEADDIIGYLALRATRPCKIISEDHDFVQLLKNKNVVLYRPQKRLLIEQKNVLNIENILPENYLYAKSICGDDSDNIKGLTVVETNRLGIYFPELSSQVYNSLEDFLITMEQTDIESLNIPPQSKTFRKALQQKIKENIAVLKRNIILMELGNLSPLDENKVKYAIEQHNNNLKMISSSTLKFIMAENKIRYNVNNFPNIFRAIAKLSRAPINL